MQYGNPAFVDRVNELTSHFGGPGSTHVTQVMTYQQLNQQADAMAYQDIYRLLWWLSIGMIAYAFLLGKNRP
jgi:DHA2 family multidrug resistance protein